MKKLIKSNPFAAFLMVMCPAFVALLIIVSTERRAAREPFADIVRVEDGRTLEFASAFVGDAKTGQVRTVFDMLVTSAMNELAIEDVNGDGYLSVTLPETVGEGEYYLTYVGFPSPKEEVWARFATQDQLQRMRPEARGYVYCTWYDERYGYIRYPDDHGCMVKVRITNAGTIEAAGNMRDFGRLQ